MRPIVVQVGPLAAPSANNIALSQTPLVAGNLTLNGALVTGGVAVLDTARRVLFTPAGAEATNTTVWTVSGTDWNGNSVSETVNGVNNPSTVFTVYDYATVTKIAVNKGQAGAVTVGTNGVASSRPINLDPYAPSPTSIQVTVSGTVNYTVQQTLDSVTGLGYTKVTWLPHPDVNLVAATANVQGNYAYIPQFCQVVLNSQTNPGFIKMTVIQSSAVPK